MTAQEILDLEVSLLLVKHGSQAVLRSFARRTQLSEEELHFSLEKLRRAEFVSTLKKKRAGRVFSLDVLLQAQPEKADVIRQLFERYENRTFLPELKDVKRFFDRNGKPTQKLKSRALAIESVFRFIADLPTFEIKRMLADPAADSGISSLGLIADEILGRNKPSTQR